MTKWNVGDVLIEKHNSNGGPPRAVVVVECPEYWLRMPGSDHYASDGSMRDRCWGMYLELSGHWGGPWHSTHDSKIPHPDPDSIWEKWAAYCAAVLVNEGKR